MILQNTTWSQWSQIDSFRSLNVISKYSLICSSKLILAVYVYKNCCNPNHTACLSHFPESGWFRVESLLHCNRSTPEFTWKLRLRWDYITQTLSDRLFRSSSKCDRCVNTTQKENTQRFNWTLHRSTESTLRSCIFRHLKTEREIRLNLEANNNNRDNQISLSTRRHMQRDSL